MTDQVKTFHDLRKETMCLVFLRERGIGLGENEQPQRASWRRRSISDSKRIFTAD
jgi:hypothetical protein